MTKGFSPKGHGQTEHAKAACGEETSLSSCLPLRAGVARTGSLNGMRRSEKAEVPPHD
jgi:hypothetical protein